MTVPEAKAIIAATSPTFEVDKFRADPSDPWTYFLKSTLTTEVESEMNTFKEAIDTIVNAVNAAEPKYILS